MSWCMIRFILWIVWRMHYVSHNISCFINKSDILINYVFIWVTWFYWNIGYKYILILVPLFIHCPKKLRIQTIVPLTMDSSMHFALLILVAIFLQQAPTFATKKVHKSSVFSILQSLDFEFKTLIFSMLCSL